MPSSVPKADRKAPRNWAQWLFVPILAGATLRDRLIACLGAFLAIAASIAASAEVAHIAPFSPFIVGPIGASAVIVFAIPTSPLAQPWPVIGGSTLSALIGVAVAQLVGDPVLAAALAVALALAAMSFTRSLHPPGGAAALTAVIGGQAVTGAGFLFPFVSIALNAAIVVALGIVFHRLTGRSYPHLPPRQPANLHRTSDPPARMRASFGDQDVDAALARLGDTFDIDRNDLDRLLREVSLQATMRLRGPLRCADIMSRDVIAAKHDVEANEARALLLRHNIRTLPVIDDEGHLLGTVGLRDLALAEGPVGAAIVRASEASPEDKALSLLPALTDGRSHAVVIVDGERRVVGLVTQTDLLAAMAGLPLRGAHAPAK